MTNEEKIVKLIEINNLILVYLARIQLAASITEIRKGDYQADKEFKLFSGLTQIEEVVQEYMRNESESSKTGTNNPE